MVDEIAFAMKSCFAGLYIDGFDFMLYSLCPHLKICTAINKEKGYGVFTVKSSI